MEEGVEFCDSVKQRHRGHTVPGPQLQSGRHCVCLEGNCEFQVSAVEETLLLLQTGLVHRLTFSSSAGRCQVTTSRAIKGLPGRPAFLL